MDDEKSRGVWIPNGILLDRKLSAAERLILAAVTHLDRENGCFAGNTQLAEMLGLDRRTVIRSVQKLTDMGYLASPGIKGKRRILTATGVQSFPQSLHKSFPQETPNCDNLTQINCDNLSHQVCQSDTDNCDNLSHSTVTICHPKKNNKNIYNNIYKGEGEAPSREDVENYRKEKVENGENVPDSLSADRFWNYYNERGWRMPGGESLTGEGWKKKFDQWAATEYEKAGKPKQMIDVQPENSSFDTDTMFIKGLRKSYASDEAFERDFPEYKGKY